MTTRTITEIYNSIVNAKNSDPTLAKINSRSKFAIWKLWADITAQTIHLHEGIMEQFEIDINQQIADQIPGVPRWYVDILLKYQDGDELILLDNGISTGYAVIDESKNIITRASYSEVHDATTGDIVLELKIAKGEAGNFEPVTNVEKGRIVSYLNKKRYAGTKIDVISKRGDFLVPTMTVYHDGILTETAVLNSVKEALYDYMDNLSFDSVVYESEIFNAVRDLEHVKDVVMTDVETASFNDLCELQPLVSFGRKTVALAGYVNESDGTTLIHGTSNTVPTFDDSITITVES